MYILELEQEGNITEIAVFDSIEDGREFVSQIEGYEFVEEDGFIYEYIYPERLPKYIEISFNGNIVPFTKFMFTSKDRVMIIWKEIPNLSFAGHGLIPGALRVDAYVIDNSEVKKYVEDRELKYQEVLRYLEEKGYSVERAYQGSEDGEAIIYKKNEDDDWHFLTHLDPCFLEVDVRALIDETI